MTARAVEGQAMKRPSTLRELERAAMRWWRSWEKVPKESQFNRLCDEGDKLHTACARHAAKRRGRKS